jgi:hypothetical protein
MPVISPSFRGYGLYMNIQIKEAAKPPQTTTLKPHQLPVNFLQKGSTFFRSSPRFKPPSGGFFFNWSVGFRASRTASGRLPVRLPIFLVKSYSVGNTWLSLP